MRGGSGSEEDKEGIEGHRWTHKGGCIRSPWVALLDGNRNNNLSSRSGLGWSHVSP